MIKLWGRTTSVNVQKVMWTLAELKIPYERIDAGGSFGKLDAPDFAALNPNRLIPVLEDDGFVLWESSAIIRYLAHRYGLGCLVGRDLQDAARADQWMEWTATSLYADIITTCFWGLVRTRRADRDETAIETAAARAGERLKILDHTLKDSNFVLGETLSIADIPAGALMYRYFKLPIERPELPNVAKWIERLRARQAYISSIEIDYSSLQVND